MTDAGRRLLDDMGIRPETDGGRGFTDRILAIEAEAVAAERAIDGEADHAAP